MKIQAWLYTLGIRIYAAIIQLAGFLGAKKAQLFLAERKRVAVPTFDQSTIWFHCASLGEFDTIFSLLNRIRVANSSKEIVVSFFSPSGLRVVAERYPELNVTYLPLDLPKRMDGFIAAIKPSLCIIAENDFWYHKLSVLREYQIPVISMGTNFRREDRWRPLDYAFVRDRLCTLDHIFVKTESALRYLHDNALKNVSYVGDPRVDTMLMKGQQSKHMYKIEEWIDGQSVLLLANLHQSDWAVWEQVKSSNLFEKIIIAPHDYDELGFDRFEADHTETMLTYSSNEYLADCYVMYIDEYGVLPNIYGLADVVYVGGGFKEGVHSIMEPLLQGAACIFGPKYQRYADIQRLLAMPQVTWINTTTEFNIAAKALKEICQEGNTEVEQLKEMHAGATDAVFSYINSEELI